MSEKISQDEKLKMIRHSMAHVMAEAVLEMFPTAQIAIGPAIENGFYYDFELPRNLTPEDLDTITQKMKDIIAQNKEFKRIEVTRAQAAEMFKDQKFKLELLEAIPEGETVTVYNQGNFTDLCRGPHVASTKELRADSFKLLNIAGAYWRGDEHNQMLTRIYGTAFTNPKDLRAYLQYLEDVEKRDHRRLGKELDLFSLHEEAGPGLVYWHPRGARVRQLIENFWREEHYKNGYEMVYPTRWKELAVGDIRPPWFLQRQHVSSNGDGQGRLLCKANELPIPHHDLSEQQEKLQRPSLPLGRAWNRL